MFNFQGGELVIILLLALVVLGPEKLPDAMRKAGSFYAELRKMSTGFQDEFRKAVDEPVAEMRKTADLVRESADFRSLAEGDRPEKPKSAEMADAPAEPDAEAAAPTFAGSADDGPEAPVDEGPADVTGGDADIDPEPFDDSMSGDDPVQPDAIADAPTNPTPEPDPEPAETTEVPKPRKNLIADANAFKPVDREQLDELRRKAEQARRDYEAAQAELDGNVDP